MNLSGGSTARSSENAERFTLLLRLGVSFLLKILTAVLAFFFTWVVSRSLTVDVAGSFFSMMSGLILLSTVSIAGQDLYAMRTTTYLFVTKQITEIMECQKGFRQRVVISSCGVSFLLLLAWYSLNIPIFISSAYQLFALAIILPLFAVTIVNCELLRGVGWLQSLVIVHGVLLPTAAAVSILAFSNYNILTLETAYLYYFACVVFAWLVSELAWRRVAVNLEKDLEGRSVIEANQVRPSHGASWLAIVAFSNLGLQYFPVVVLETAVDAKDAGLFFVALKISMFLAFCLLAVNVVMGPLMARAQQLQDIGALRRLMKISNLVGFTTSAPLFLLVFLHGDYFLDIFGEGYAEAFSILQVLALGQLINSSCGSVLNLLIMTGNERVAAVITLSGFIFMIFSLAILTSITAITMAWLFTLAFVGINLSALLWCYLVVLRH